MDKDGYPREWFVDSDEILQDVFCSICMGICRDPQQCINGHLFCKDCVLKAYQKNGRSCPQCRVGKLTSEHLSNNLFAKKAIDKLRVRCVCHTVDVEGCGWIGALIQRQERFQECVLSRQ